MKNYLKKEPNFVIISGHATKSSAFFGFGPRGCHLANLRFHRNNFGGTIFADKSGFSSLLDIECNLFSFLAKFLRLGCKHCFSRDHRKTLWSMFPLKKVLISILGNDRMILFFCRNFFDGLVKTAFYLSLGTYWGESDVYGKSVFSSFLDIAGFAAF